MKSSKKTVKSKGAHGLRIELMNVRYHLEAAEDALSAANRRASELGVVDQLAVAVKALRAIVNSKETDRRSRGVAAAALDRMEVKR